MKFNVGDKVTPFRKTGVFSCSMERYYTNPNGKFLKENGFLYVTRIVDNDCYILSNVKDGSGGDYFYESDLKTDVQLELQF